MLGLEGIGVPLIYAWPSILNLTNGPLESHSVATAKIPFNGIFAEIVPSEIDLVVSYPNHNLVTESYLTILEL